MNDHSAWSFRVKGKGGWMTTLHGALGLKGRVDG